jgi:hypothetical protein
MKIYLTILSIFAFQITLCQSAKEDFNTFYQKFFGDSIYQNSRILFPLTWHQESPIVETKDSVIEKSKWVYSDFGFYKNHFNVRVYDNFQKKFRPTDKMLVSFEGVECGINYNFYFKRIKGKWFLIKINDYSD